MPHPTPQVATLCDAWAGFKHFVAIHHNHEEDLIFPWMSTRVAVPPKMSADHQARRPLAGP